MTGRKRLLYGTLFCTTMLIVILDGRNAVAGIREGINLCLQTVIPALFPFFVLSGMINSCFLGLHFRILAPLQRICKIPEGTESILLVGLLSGYPVGAQLVTDAYAQGNLSKQNARRMLGFCSNAGPAFIFGMLAVAFTNRIIPWVLWGIHIVSAIAVGWVLPGEISEKCTLPNKSNISITKSLHNAIRNIALVCGWVILFRMLLYFLDKWFLWLLPSEIQVLISGFIELTNGSVMLQLLKKEGTRFVLAAAMLAFGGLCVAMQTGSVVKDLGTGFYFPGKLLQMIFSVMLGCTLQPILFQRNSTILLTVIPVTMLAFLSVLTIGFIRRKKVVAFEGNMLYNKANKSI